MQQYREGREREKKREQEREKRELVRTIPTEGAPEEAVTLVSGVQLVGSLPRIDEFYLWNSL